MVIDAALACGTYQLLNDAGKWTFGARRRLRNSKHFFEEQIYPNEAAVAELVASREGKARWEPIPLVEELKPKALAAGLWNLFLPIAEQSIWLERIANCRIVIDQARLLVLNAADRMDRLGNKAARREIAMIEVAAPAMLNFVVDWAIQAYGAAGVTSDFGLGQIAAGALARTQENSSSG